MKDFVVVKVFSYRHQAEHLKSFFEAEGIESAVWADDVGGMRPELAFGMGGVRLLVSKKDLDKAQEVLQAFEQNNCDDKDA